MFLTNPGQTPPVNKAAFLKMKEVFKSVVVVAMFSGVPSDYVLKEDYWHVLLTKLKYDHNLNFYYDDYAIWRKTAGVLAGLGKIGENRLFWSRKFGFKTKIELMLIDDDIDESYTLKGDHKLALCEKCDEKWCMNSPKGCPILKEKETFKFFQKCQEESHRWLDENMEEGYWKQNGVGTTWAQDEKYGNCTYCQTGCPYSETLIKKNVPEHQRDRRYFHYFVEWPFVSPNLAPFSFRLKLNKQN